MRTSRAFPGRPSPPPRSQSSTSRSPISAPRAPGHPGLPIRDSRAPGRRRSGASVKETRIERSRGGGLRTPLHRVRALDSVVKRRPADKVRCLTQRYGPPKANSTPAVVRDTRSHSTPAVVRWPFNIGTSLTPGRGLAVGAGRFASPGTLTSRGSQRDHRKRVQNLQVSDRPVRDSRGGVSNGSDRSAWRRCSVPPR